MKQKFRTKNNKSPKIGGGIAVYVSQELAGNFRLIPNENVDSIWIRSVGSVETVLGFYYCSPDYGNSNFSEVVLNEIQKFSTKNTFIFGDFNARTKNECENIVCDKYDANLGIDSTIRELPLPRNSEDMKTNNRGKEFLDICRIQDLTIANGRTMGDLFGKYTCHQTRGSSVVDYLITHYKSIHNLIEFRVGEFQPLLSDHCPIKATICLDSVMKCNQEPEIPMEKLPNKYIWDADSSDTFTNILKSEEYEHKVQALLDKKDLKMEDVKELLMATANTAKIRKTKARNKKKDQPWFDKECLVTKKEIMLCGKVLRSNPEDVDNREKLYTSKRKLRNMIKKNKNEYKKSTINNMCSDLSNGEQKQYWKNLRKLEGRVEEHKYIPDFALVDHFKLLLFDR